MNGSDLNLNKAMTCRNCGLSPLYWDKWQKKDGSLISRLFDVNGVLHSCAPAPNKPRDELSSTQRRALANAGTGKVIMTHEEAPREERKSPMIEPDLWKATLSPGYKQPTPKVVPINLVPSSYPLLWAQYQELRRLFEGVPDNEKE